MTYASCMITFGPSSKLMRAVPKTGNLWFEAVYTGIASVKGVMVRLALFIRSSDTIVMSAPVSIRVKVCCPPTRSKADSGVAAVTMLTSWCFITAASDAGVALALLVCGGAGPGVGDSGRVRRRLVVSVTANESLDSANSKFPPLGSLGVGFLFKLLQSLGNLSTWLPGEFSLTLRPILPFDVLGSSL